MPKSKGYCGRFVADMCFSLLLAACSAFQPSSTPNSIGIGVVIRPQDLPPGWLSLGPSNLNRVDPSAYSWLAAYVSEDDPTRLTINIQQQLTVFMTAQSAKSAYEQWDAKWFPTTNWLTPPGAQFAPRDPDDQYHYACLFVAGASLTACRYLQRHVNLVSLVIANIDGQSMTFSQFGQIIDGIDSRLTLVH
jgi:hypothetical protein